MAEGTCGDKCSSCGGKSKKVLKPLLYPKWHNVEIFCENQNYLHEWRKLLFVAAHLLTPECKNEYSYVVKNVMPMGGISKMTK